MRTGIFGGAFNPFHNGHLHLMNSYLKALSLDRIILIPTNIPPHKTAEFLAKKEDRIQMLQAVADENEKLEVSDIEFRREQKSYTFDTVCELKQIYPNDVFFLIVGSDQYLYFQNWYRADELLSMVTVCTAARNQGEYQKLKEFQRQYPNMEKTMISDFDVVEISSSAIRERVKAGKSITNMVPSCIEKYIREHRLYV